MRFFKRRNSDNAHNSGGSKAIVRNIRNHKTAATVAAIGVIALFGMTMAYFTSTDAVTNRFVGSDPVKVSSATNKVSSKFWVKGNSFGGSRNITVYFKPTDSNLIEVSYDTDGQGTITYDYENRTDWNNYSRTVSADWYKTTRLSKDGYYVNPNFMGSVGATPTANSDVSPFDYWELSYNGKTYKYTKSGEFKPTLSTLQTIIQDLDLTTNEKISITAKAIFKTPTEELGSVTLQAPDADNWTDKIITIYDDTTELEIITPPTKEGYTFDGWEYNGSVVDWTLDSIKNLINNATGNKPNLVLTAKFKEIESDYKIIYQLSDDTTKDNFTSAVDADTYVNTGIEYYNGVSTQADAAGVGMKLSDTDYQKYFIYWTDINGTILDTWNVKDEAGTFAPTYDQIIAGSTEGEKDVVFTAHVIDAPQIVTILGTNGSADIEAKTEGYLNPLSGQQTKVRVQDNLLTGIKPNDDYLFDGWYYKDEPITVVSKDDAKNAFVEITEPGWDRIKFIQEYLKNGNSFTLEARFKLDDSEALTHISYAVENGNGTLSKTVNMFRERNIVDGQDTYTLPGTTVTADGGYMVDYWFAMNSSGRKIMLQCTTEKAVDNKYTYQPVIQMNDEDSFTLDGEDFSIDFGTDGTTVYAHMTRVVEVTYSAVNGVTLPDNLVTDYYLPEYSVNEQPYVTNESVTAMGSDYVYWVHVNEKNDVVYGLAVNADSATIAKREIYKYIINNNIADSLSLQAGSNNFSFEIDLGYEGNWMQNNKNNITTEQSKSYRIGKWDKGSRKQDYITIVGLDDGGYLKRTAGEYNAYVYDRNAPEWYIAGWVFDKWEIIGDNGTYYYNTQNNGRDFSMLPWWDFLEKSTYRAEAKVKPEPHTVIFAQESTGYGSFAANDSYTNRTEDASENIVYHAVYGDIVSGSVTNNPVAGIVFDHWDYYKNGTKVTKPDAFTENGQTVTFTITNIEDDYKVVAVYQKQEYTYTDEEGTHTYTDVAIADDYVEIRYHVLFIGQNTIKCPVNLTVDGKKVYNYSSTIAEADAPYISEIVKIGDDAKGCYADCEEEKYSDGYNYYFVGWKDENSYLILRGDGANEWKPSGKYIKDRIKQTDDKIIHYYAEGRQVKNYYIFHKIDPSYLENSSTKINISENPMFLAADAANNVTFVTRVLDKSYTTDFVVTDAVTEEISLSYGYSRSSVAATGDLKTLLDSTWKLSGNQIQNKSTSEHKFTLGNDRKSVYTKDGTTRLMYISDDGKYIYNDSGEILFTIHDHIFRNSNVQVNNVPDGYKVDHWTYNGVEIPAADGAEVPDSETIVRYIRSQTDNENILAQEHANILVAYLVSTDPNVIIHYRAEYDGYLSRTEDVVTYDLLLGADKSLGTNDDLYLDGSIAYAQEGFKFLYWQAENGDIVTNKNYLDYLDHIAKYIPATKEDMKKSPNYTKDANNPDTGESMNGTFEYTFTAVFTDAIPAGKVTYDINLPGISAGDVKVLDTETPYLTALQQEQDAKSSTLITTIDGRTITPTPKNAVVVNGIVYTTDDPIGYAERFYVTQQIPAISKADYQNYVFVGWYDGEKQDADGNLKSPQIVAPGKETEYLKYVFSSNNPDVENVYDFAAIWAIASVDAVIVPYDKEAHTVTTVRTSLAAMGDYADEIAEITGGGIAGEIVGYSDTQLAADSEEWLTTWSKITPQYDGNGNVIAYTPWVKIKLMVGNEATYMVTQASLTIVPANVKLTKISTEKTTANKEIVLSGATFKIYDINNDGTPLTFDAANHYTAEGSVTEFTTGADGTITLSGMPEGTYYFKETSAPMGYRILTDKIYFHLTDDDYSWDSDGNPVVQNTVVHQVKAENVPEMCTLTVNKTITLASGLTLADVSIFGTPTFLIKVSSKADADGKYDTVTGKPGEYTGIITITDADTLTGTAVFHVPYGTYTVEEVAVARYGLDTTKEVKFTQGGQSKTAILTNSLTNYAKFSANDKETNTFQSGTKPAAFLTLVYTGAPISIGDYLQTGGTAGKIADVSGAANSILLSAVNIDGGTVTVDKANLTYEEIKSGNVVTGIKVSYTLDGLTAEDTIPIENYTITYHANSEPLTAADMGSFVTVDGESVNEITVLYDGYGNAYSGSYTQPVSASMTDYTFEGWVDGDGNTVLVTNPANLQQNTDLYAVYAKKSIRVIFHSNTDEDVTSVQNVPLNERFRLNDFSGLGWTSEDSTFSHWNTLADGTGKTYQDGDFVSARNSDLHLYAQWEQYYHIIYNANNGTNDTADAYQESAAFTVPGARDGWSNGDKVFTGWSIKADGSRLVTGTIDLSNYADENMVVPLYAVWENAGFTITFDGNGSTGGTMTPQRTAGTGALNANTFTKTGYAFVGWSTSQNGTVEYENSSNFTITGDLTLYAVWKIPLKLMVNGSQSGETEYVDLGDTYTFTEKSVTNKIHYAWKDKNEKYYKPTTTSTTLTESMLSNEGIVFTAVFYNDPATNVNGNGVGNWIGGSSSDFTNIPDGQPAGTLYSNGSGRRNISMSFGTMPDFSNNYTIEYDFALANTKGQTGEWTLSLDSMLTLSTTEINVTNPSFIISGTTQTITLPNQNNGRKNVNWYHVKLVVNKQTNTGALVITNSSGEIFNNNISLSATTPSGMSASLPRNGIFGVREFSITEN